jgi:hypothetical protein
MRRDVRFAAAARDHGIGKVAKITWQAALISLVSSGLIALAFDMHATAQSSGGSGGSISVPAQPPGQGQGAGKVTSGGS